MQRTAELFFRRFVWRNRRNVFFLIVFLVLFLVFFLYIPKSNAKADNSWPSMHFEDDGRSADLLNSEQRATTQSGNKRDPWGSDPLLHERWQAEQAEKPTEPNYSFHIFYYPWYGNIGFDNQWLHWDHPYLSHWNKAAVVDSHAGERHTPPDDVGASFYPRLGAYSSRDPHVIAEHMRQIRSAGTGVVVVSWYPAGSGDDQGKSWDDLIPKLLDAAAKEDLKLTLHIEPYRQRNVVTVRRDVSYIVQNYASHPAFYRRRTSDGRELPMLYVYDSYQIGVPEWQTLLLSSLSQSIRNTSSDCLMMGLLVHREHKQTLLSAGFDGYYTYFASDIFTYGSNRRNWAELARFAQKHRVLFSPSVGPGYIDTEVRAWNGANSRDREEGMYLNRGCDAVLDAAPPLVTVTSFNEWHEGSQIEPAIPRGRPGGRRYLDYLPYSSDYYLQLTRRCSDKFHKAFSRR